MSNIKVNRTVFSKDQFDKVIDRSFTSFIPEVQEEVVLTVSDLFQLYEDLFYEIPAYGESNSHEYLITRSRELVDFDKTTEDIDPLLEEITQLREQLLQANQQIVELQSDIKIDG